jgi:hypothetical protein
MPLRSGSKWQADVWRDHQYLEVNLENASSSMLAADNLDSMAFKASRDNGLLLSCGRVRINT